MSKLSVVICGSGQQGRCCKRLALENGYEVVGFVDDYMAGEVEGVPVYRNIEAVKDFQQHKYFVAIGAIEPRKHFIDEIKRLGLSSVNLIDRSAFIENGAEIGTGNYIGKAAIIYSSAKIGDYNIVNCKAVLATDSVVGSNNNISLGCNICGGASIGDDCYVGCQASVVSECKIGDGAVVAAGSTVLKDVPAAAFVAGSPATQKSRSGKTTLVIAPHPDDEVLGVGGTIANRAEAGNKVVVCICTKGTHSMFDPEVIKRGREEAVQAHTFLGVSKTIFLDLPAAELDTVPMTDIIGRIEEVVKQVRPDEVFIPHRGDIHRDHKTIVDASMVALRPKCFDRPFRILSYEVPSETGWDMPAEENAFVPDVYENITGTIGKKLGAVGIYESQAEEWPGARSVEAVRSLAKYRGSTVCVPYAESFRLIRQTL